jgi:cytochrome c553
LSQSGAERKSAANYDARMKPALLLAALSVLAVRCGRSPAAPATPTPAPSPKPPAAAAVWVPDLGDLMLQQQMRHAKLWLAGEAGNWKLAAYECDELREGFEEIARLHPTHKQAPVPIDQAIETIIKEPIDKLAQAIAKADRKAFEESFDTVTAGCNSCHGATDYGFSVLQRPKSNPFPNQDFAAK